MLLHTGTRAVNMQGGSACWSRFDRVSLKIPSRAANLVHKIGARVNATLTTVQAPPRTITVLAMLPLMLACLDVGAGAVKGSSPVTYQQS